MKKTVILPKHKHDHYKCVIMDVSGEIVNWLKHIDSLLIDDKSQKDSNYSYAHFKPISGHFFANSINFFHKTEALTVILRCLKYVSIS